jgi:hypothetical protein
VTVAVQNVSSFITNLRSGDGAFAATRTIAVAAFGAIKGAITTTVSTIVGLVRGFSEGKTGAVALGGALAAVTAGFIAFKVATSIVSGVTAVIGVVTKVTKAWAVAQALLNAVMATNPFVLGAVAIAALGAAMVVAYKKSQTFRNIVDGAFRGVKAAGRWLVEAGKDIASWVSGAVSDVHRFASGVAKWIDNAAGNIKRFPGRVVEFFKALPGKMLGIGKDVISGLANGIRAKLDDLKNFVVRLATGVIGWFKDAIGAHSPSREFHKIGEYIAEGLRDGIKAGKPWVEAAAKTGLLFPIDAAIAALNAKKEKLQTSMAAWDTRRQRRELVQNVRDARREDAAGGSSSGGGAGSPSGVRASVTGKPVIAGGRFLQGRGLQVAESKYFGGVTTNRHAHYANDHYSGNSIDVNAAGGGAAELSKLKPALAAIRKRFGSMIQSALIEDIGSANQHLHVTFKDSAGKAKAVAAKVGAKVSGKAATIAAAARKAGIDPAILWGVFGAESNFGKNKNTSSAGARGPFQFMPGTARSLGIDPMNFGQAASGAARYLAQFKNRGVAGMLAAYNAGPAGNPNNAETRAYIPKVLALAKSFPGGKGGGSSSGGGGGSTVAEAVKALREFDREQARVKKNAKYDLKIAGLERLKAMKSALEDVRSTIKDKVQAAAENFRSKWDGTIGEGIKKANEKILKSFDDTTAGILQNFDDVKAAALQAFDDVKNAQLEAFDIDTEGIIAGAPANSALAAARAAANAEDVAAQDKAEQKALADAIKSGDQEAIAAAKETIRKTARERNITALETAAADERVAIQKARAAERTSIERANAAERTGIERANAAERKTIEETRAAERGAIEDRMLAEYTARMDAETAAFAASLQTRLNAEIAQLKDRKQNYADFVEDVNAMLQPLGLGFEPTAEQEALLNGTNPAAPAHQASASGPAGGPGGNSTWNPAGYWEWPDTVGGKSGEWHLHPNATKAVWVPRRAKGGPVSAGSPYLVGEKGIELFVPDRSGQIIPNDRVGRGGGGNVIIEGDLVVNNRQDATRMANKLAFRMVTG